MFGAGNVVDTDYLTHGVPSLLGGAYGYGQYSAIEGVGGVTQFSTTAVNSVFNLVFGSYFGDWDTQNNAMRGILAAPGNSLVTIWSSRPTCHLHSMGMGRTVGESVQGMMNQSSDSYMQIGYSSRSVSIGLMGDPTLRLLPVTPVRNVTGQLVGSTANLTWAASTDTAANSAFIYRLNPGETTPVLLTPTPVSGTTYSDTAATSSTRYMISAAKLETTSGTFWNRSLAVETGLTATADPIAGWKSSVFGAAASNAAIAGDLADPDRDGSCNLLEYAGGTDPLNSSSKVAMTNVKINGTGALRVLTADFRVCNAASGVSITYQCSSGMKTWATITTPVVVSTNATHTTYRVSVSAVGSKCFFRALVRRN
jgi:hypothetical protein